MRSLTVKTIAVATVIAAAVAAPLGAQDPRMAQAPRAADAQQSIMRFGQPSPAPQNPAFGPEEDLEGTVEVLVEDHATETRVHHFLDTNRGRMRLREAPGRAELAGLTTGTRIRARGRIAQDGTLELNNSSGGGSVTTMALASPNTFGQQNVAVIMVNFQDNAAQPYAWTHAADVTFNQVSKFFLENSYGQTSLAGDVFGWFTIAQSSSVCDYNQLASLADQAAANAGVNLNNYSRRIYAFPSNACSWWGLGTVGGNPSRAWIKGTYAMKVVAHELGHNFGDWHSNSQPCESAGCTTKDYGHDRDTMGGPGAGHFNAYQKERLGWLNYGSSPSIQTVTGPGTYFINSLPAAGSGTKALKILRAGNTSGNIFYYLEARTQTGFDAGYAPGVLMSTGNDINGNSSYQVDFDPYSSAFDPNLDPGQSFSDGSIGLTVRTVSIDASGAWVTIDMPGSSCTSRAPTVSMSPGSATTSPSVATSYTVSVRNNDDAACASSEFGVGMTVPSGWTWSAAQASKTLSPGATGTVSVMVTPPASASGTSSVSANVSRANGPGGTAAGSVLVTTPATGTLLVSVDVRLNVSNQLEITATVLSGVTPVTSGQVSAVVTSPDGIKTTLSGTISTRGVAVVKHKIRPKDPRGAYRVSVTATSGSATGTGLGDGYY